MTYFTKKQVGLIVTTLLISGSIVYGASSGTIGSLFEKVGSDYKLLGTNIKDNSITSAQLANDSVTTSKLADNSVNSSKIVDLTVGSGDLANNSVTTLKLADNSVNSIKIQDGTIQQIDLDPSINFGGADIWQKNGSSIYYNSGNVYVGAFSSGAYKFNVSGTTNLSGDTQINGDTSLGGDVNLSNSGRLYLTSLPISNNEAVTKEYVDALLGGPDPAYSLHLDGGMYGSAFLQRDANFNITNCTNISWPMTSCPTTGGVNVLPTCDSGYNLAILSSSQMNTTSGNIPLNANDDKYVTAYTCIKNGNSIAGHVDGGMYGSAFLQRDANFNITNCTNMSWPMIGCPTTGGGGALPICTFGYNLAIFSSSQMNTTSGNIPLNANDDKYVTAYTCIKNGNNMIGYMNGGIYGPTFLQRDENFNVTSVKGGSPLVKFLQRGENFNVTSCTPSSCGVLEPTCGGGYLKLAILSSSQMNTTNGNRPLNANDDKYVATYACVPNYNQAAQYVYQIEPNVRGGIYGSAFLQRDANFNITNCTNISWPMTSCPTTGGVNVLPTCDSGYNLAILSSSQMNTTSGNRPLNANDDKYATAYACVLN